MAEIPDPFAMVSGQANLVLPRLRPDLRRGRQTGSASDPRFELVDPRAGRSFSFTAAELRLCELADGQTDLPAILAAHAASFPDPMTPDELMAFYRRLRVLGLLSNEPAGTAAAAPRGAAGRIAARRGGATLVRPAPSAAASPAAIDRATPADTDAAASAPADDPTPEIAPPGDIAPAPDAALADVPAEGDPATQAAPLDPNPLAQPAATDPTDLATPRRTPRRRTAAPLRKAAAPRAVAMSEGEDAPAAPLAEPAPRAPAAADLPPAEPVTTTAAPEPSAEPTPAPLPPTEPDLAPPAAPARAARRARKLAELHPAAKPAASPAAPATAAAAADLSPVPSPTPSEAFTRHFADLTQGLAQEPTHDLALDMQGSASLDDEFGELLQAEAPAPGPRGAAARGALAGGGMGGGLGGFGGGGLGGGGFGGGGFGGGGMGGGFGGGGFGGGGMGGGGAGGGANGERLKALMAARRARGGAGAGAAPETGEGETRPMGVALFNPTWLLHIVYVLFFPARFLDWLVLPVVLLAGMTIFQRWDAFLSDFILVGGGLSAVGKIFAGLVTVNLAARLAQGGVILHYGGKVRSIGITLDFGFLPRFFIDISSIPDLPRAGQLWAYAAPVLARVWLFALGIILWAATRNSGTWFSYYSILVGQFGLAMAVRSALPVIPGDGQRFMAIYFDDPRLLTKSLLALRHVLFGKPLPPSIGRQDLLPMAAYGAATALVSGGGFLVLSMYVATQLTTEMGGLGLSIFLILAMLCALFYIIMATSVRRRMEAMGIGTRGAGLARLLMQDDPDAQLAEAQAKGETRPSAWARVIWSALAIGLLVVAFLPYNYETGGAVQVLPAARAQAIARTSGEILTVMVAEGAMVTEGQDLARLSAWDQDNAVKVTEAELAEAQAELDKLKAGPKPEEVDLAQKRVDSARASLELTKAEMERNRGLLASGTVSQQTFDKSNSAYLEDLANLAVAEASLRLTQSGATAQELAMAQAKVDQLTQELSFRRDEQGRTVIRAPMTGRVVTPNLDLLRGSYLTTGQTLLEIERTDVIKASIDLPESDVGLIHPGSAVRLKVWGNSDAEITGTVDSVGSAARDQSTGSVVQVLASFDNRDGLLRSNMTGYAKIEGGQMMVWQAYLRSIVHFFQIEVWSWIP